MTFRYALGPVFYFEWLIASRRWQQFVGRSLFVLLLFLSLFIVWLAEGATGTASRRYLADIGEKFFYAVIGTQLTLVLLVAPAVTAGAVCLDKARGTLLHLLATDLSNVEIILGKLVQRLLTLFSLVLCALPVLFLGALEGGIDLEALLGSFLVTLGIVLFTATLALTFSVWCTKTYEVLLATYLLIFLTMLFNPAVHILGVKRTLPFWVEALNPYWMVFAQIVPASKQWMATCARRWRHCWPLWPSGACARWRFTSPISS